jgi:hypothetical protein
MLSFLSAAQDAPASNSVPSPAQAQNPTQGSSTRQTKSQDEKEIEKREQSQRALKVLPTFGYTSRQNAPPLSSGEKFHLFVKSAFDPAIFVVVGLQAGLSQATNEFPAYGQGAAGYGKRYGASMADNVSSGFWSGYFYPVVFKQDPRYFRLGEGGFEHRLFYGVKQEFVCHTDHGGRAFAWSNVLGAFTSGAMSNLYYPGRSLISTTPATATTPAIPHYEDDRGAVLTLSRSMIAIGYGVAGNLFDEFWPDFSRKFSRKHKDQATKGGNPSQ